MPPRGVAMQPLLAKQPQRKRVPVMAIGEALLGM